MLKAFDFQCQECGFHDVEYVDDPKETLPCPECEAKAYFRVWVKMPGVTRASYIDSNKTARAAEFAGEKRAAQLDVQAASLDHKSDEYKGLKKEAKELRKINK